LALLVCKHFNVRRLQQDKSTKEERFKVEELKWVATFKDLWPTLNRLDQIQEPYTLYATLKPNEPVADLVCAADVAFQIGDAKDGIQVKSMLEILDATKTARKEKKLRLYLVVPEEFSTAKAQTLLHPPHDKTKNNQTKEEYDREKQINEQRINRRLSSGSLPFPIPFPGMT
jgi:hypothetical protein